MGASAQLLWAGHAPADHLEALAAAGSVTVARTHAEAQAVAGGREFDAVIVDRRAKLAVCCYNGAHEVAVIDPPACVSPLVTTCP